jgi:hypothetical protein
MKSFKYYLQEALRTRPESIRLLNAIYDKG